MLLVFLYIYCAIDHDDSIVVAGFIDTEESSRRRNESAKPASSSSSTFHFIQAEKLLHLTE